MTTAGTRAKATKARGLASLKLALPSPQTLKRIAKTLELTPDQSHELALTLKHMVADLETFQQRRSGKPPREDQIQRLKRIEKALAGLLQALAVPPDDLTDLMPWAARDFVASALSVSAMRDVLGADALSNPARLPEAVGLLHAGALFKAFITDVHSPFSAWVEEDRLNKGGRPPDQRRRILLIYLVKAAPDILGRQAAVSDNGPFVRLCQEVFLAFGLETDGLDKAIPAIVRSYRGSE
jgi:hypothetical protein